MVVTLRKEGKKQRWGEEEITWRALNSSDKYHFCLVCIYVPCLPDPPATHEAPWKIKTLKNVSSCNKHLSLEQMWTDTFSALTHTLKARTIISQITAVCLRQLLCKVCSWSSGRFSLAVSVFGFYLTSLTMCCGNNTHCGCWLTSKYIYSTLAVVEHH